MREENTNPLRIDIVTVFPEMLRGYLNESMLKRAANQGAVEFGLINPRAFTTDVHHSTDDRPYGGGPGMVMLPDPIMQAVESVATPETKVIMMTPSGKQFCQQDARRLAKEKHLVFICGHYEGIDDRVRQLLNPEEISIGDYVLTNGAIAAAVVVDAVTRLIPGVLGGGEGATEDESFENGLLEYPQFTRPVEYRGLKVPEVLQSGNHKAIAEWRQAKAEELTLLRRPDLAQALGLPRKPEEKSGKTRKRRRGNRQASNENNLVEPQTLQKEETGCSAATVQELK